LISSNKKKKKRKAIPKNGFFSDDEESTELMIIAPLGVDQHKLSGLVNLFTPGLERFYMMCPNLLPRVSFLHCVKSYFNDKFISLMLTPGLDCFKRGRTT
jgi:hypothetical protein